MPRHAIASPTTSPYRWVMLGVLWFAYLGFGMVNASIAPLITPVCDDLGLSRSAMGIALGTWAAVYIAASIPMGTLLDRIGTRKGLAIGILLIACSGIARAIAVDFFSLAAAVAVFGLGGPLLSVGAPKLIAQWFDAKERGTAVGFYMTGPFIGTAFALSSANSLFMPLYDNSWRLTIFSYAVVAIAAGVAWYFAAREPQDTAGPHAGKHKHAGLQDFKRLLRVPVIRTVLLIALAGFMFNHATASWLAEILRSRGMDATAAGYWASVPTLVGILSSLTIPRFATAERRVVILRSMYGILFVASLLLAFGNMPAIQVGLVLLGIARIMGPVAMLVLMDAPRVDARNMGAATGMYFTIGEVGGMIGPTVIGIAADVAGNFDAGILLLAGLAAYLFCMTFVLQKALAGAASGRPPAA